MRLQQVVKDRVAELKSQGFVMTQETKDCWSHKMKQTWVNESTRQVFSVYSNKVIGPMMLTD